MFDGFCQVKVPGHSWHGCGDGAFFGEVLRRATSRELVGSDGSQHIDTDGHHRDVEVLEIDSLKATPHQEVKLPRCTLVGRPLTRCLSWRGCPGSWLCEHDNTHFKTCGSLGIFGGAGTEPEPPRVSLVTTLVFGPCFFPVPGS